MKLRFSWTVRQDTTVGLLPGIAGKIRVQRGLPPSRFSRFQTLTYKRRYVGISKYEVLGGQNLASNITVLTASKVLEVRRVNQDNCSSLKKDTQYKSIFASLPFDLPRG